MWSSAPPRSARWSTNPPATVFGAKRLIGRKVDAPERPGWTRRAAVSHRRGATNGDAWVAVARTPRRPQEISALVLAEMQARRRGLPRRAGRRARSSPCPRTSTTSSARPRATPARSPASTVARILNEPTAAALGYGVAPAAATSASRCSTSAAARSTSRSCAIENGVFEVLATARRHVPRRRRLRSRASSSCSPTSFSAEHGDRPRAPTRSRCSASRRRPSAPRSSCRRR